MRWIVLLPLLVILCGCHHPTDVGPVAVVQQPDHANASDGSAEAGVTAAISPPLGDADDAGYRELDWTAMMPAAEVAAMERGDGPKIDHSGTHAMPQIGTYNTVAGVLGRKVRLPGYVVPLENDDAGKLIEFLFVPYYGACIHVPPPPPNQIVHVRLNEPIDEPDMYSPFYLSGQLRAERSNGELAGSAYSMQDAKLQPYGR